MYRRLLAFIMVWALCLSFVPGASGSNVTAEAASKTKLSNTSVSLIVGKTKTITLKNCKKAVKWSVTSGGVVKAVKKSKYKVKVTAEKKGTATLTAKVGKKKYKCKFTVSPKTVAVNSISLSSHLEKVIVGGYAFIDNTISPSNASNKTVVWSSTNTSVCEVVNGVVYGKAAGNAVVTATVDNKTASCAIVVEDVKGISNARLERNSKNTGYNLSFSLTTTSNSTIKANGTAHVSVYNTNKESMFKKDYFFTDSEFVNRSSATYISNIYMVSVPILDKEYNLTSASADGLISLSLDLMSGNEVKTYIAYISTLKNAASSDASIIPAIDIEPEKPADTSKDEVVSADASAKVYVYDRYIEYDSVKKTHNVVFSVKRADTNQYTAGSGNMTVTLYNGGKVVYNAKISFTDKSFGYRNFESSGKAYMATVPLEESKILAGAENNGFAVLAINLNNSINSTVSAYLPVDPLKKIGDDTSGDANAVSSVYISGDAAFDVTSSNVSVTLQMRNYKKVGIKSAGEAKIVVKERTSGTSLKEVYSGTTAINENAFVSKAMPDKTIYYEYKLTHKIDKTKLESGKSYLIEVTVTSKNGKSATATLYDSKYIAPPTPASTTQATTEAPSTTEIFFLDTPTYNKDTNKLNFKFRVVSGNANGSETIKIKCTARIAITSGNAQGEGLFTTEYDVDNGIPYIDLDDYESTPTGMVADITINAGNIKPSSGKGFLTISLDTVKGKFLKSTSTTLTNLPVYVPPTTEATTEVTTEAPPVYAETVHEAKEIAVTYSTELKVDFKLASCNASANPSEVIISGEGTINYKIMVSGDASDEVICSADAHYTTVNFNEENKITSVLATPQFSGNSASGNGVIVVDIYYDNKKIGSKAIEVTNLPVSNPGP